MDNHYQTYYSNLSCYEEFDIKLVLAGEKDKILDILKSISEKVDNYFWISTKSDFVWFDNKGNHIDVPEKINGNFYFDCSDINITTLVGSPKEVSGSFWCNNTDITSLEGCPQKVDGDFYCSFTKITSCKGCPQKVGGDFNCSNTNITSLEDAPQEVGGSYFCFNTNITSLEGAPQEVGGDFNCSNTNITSLEGCPQKVGGVFYCSNTKISKKEIKAYKKFLKHPTPEHIDETGHYKP